ncbi:MAG: class I SAM-dependent methyltransferase [Deltaproteobacteria bacterium]|nr:class I SAM-dependent methyltransferase [Deltaproteobacteria bacterium]
MSEAPYPADLYALLHRGTPGDLAFYSRQCAGASAVLELGCGYGRVLEALARAGSRVLGLERDGDLLALAAARRRRLEAPAAQRIALVRGDMRHFELTRRFDRILIPHSGLYCLLSEVDCTRCLECVAAHLTDDGLLILDAYAADSFHQLAEATTPLRTTPDPHWEDEEFEPLVSVEQNGRVYDVTEASRWTPAQQRLDVVYRYRSRDGGAPSDGHIPQRYLLASQLPGQFEAAGLQLLSLHGDFRGNPFREDSEQLVAVARLAPRSWSGR